MEPEGSLPYSQVPATCPYPEPTPSSPHDPLQLPPNPFCQALFSGKLEMLIHAPFKILLQGQIPYCSTWMSFVP
jgi:hypothetical protein